MSGLNFGFLILAAILDVSANLLLEKSDGFKHKKYGIPALVMVCVAFTLLAQVAQVMDLAIAYVTWGAMAIIGTVTAAWFLFGQRLNWIGWVGIATIFTSIIILKTA
jgi:spermidine export protein MdtI